jgi:hypothetical protein
VSIQYIQSPNLEVPIIRHANPLYGVHGKSPKFICPIISIKWHNIQNIGKNKKYSSWKQNPENDTSITGAMPISLTPSQIISKLLALEERLWECHKMGSNGRILGTPQLSCYYQDAGKTPNCVLSLLHTGMERHNKQINGIKKEYTQKYTS